MRKRESDGPQGRSLVDGGFQYPGPARISGVSGETLSRMRKRESDGPQGRSLVDGGFQYPGPARISGVSGETLSRMRKRESDGPQGRSLVDGGFQYPRAARGGRGVVAQDLRAQNLSHAARASSAMTAPAVSIPTSTADGWRPTVNDWCNSSEAA